MAWASLSLNYIKIPEYLFPKKKTLSNLNKCLFSMKRDKRRVSNINSFSSQVKEYGTVPAGIHRKSPEYEAVFRPENFRILSSAFRSLSCAFRQELVVNHRKKSRNFPGWNAASMFRWLPVYSWRIQSFFHLFPAGSFGIWSSESSTWVHSWFICVSLLFQWDCTIKFLLNSSFMYIMTTIHCLIFIIIDEINHKF